MDDLSNLLRKRKEIYFDNINLSKNAKSNGYN